LQDYANPRRHGIREVSASDVSVSSQSGAALLERRPARWTLVTTVLALLAFAANSLFCRLALRGATIDAASFTSIRLASGAAILFAVVTMSRAGHGLRTTENVRWRSAVALFVYAITFSFAYLSLSAGTGALILFGSVQTTMLIAAIGSGERPRLLEWVGLLCGIGGLVYLIFPGLAAPPLGGSMLMAAAGISWGLYSLWGRQALNPLAATTRNFVRTLPFVIVSSVIFMSRFHVTGEGAIIAVASGALASALGYIAWYAALRGLTATRAAIVQLSVPVIAAAGGVIFLSEAVTLRLVASAAIILGGIGLAVIGRYRR
jgi:drug/metabolite transporter (DMT)-like permease